MSFQDNYVLAKFGIDEIYIHEGLNDNLLQKLHQRAVLSLDAEDSIVQKYVSYDMVLIFHKITPTSGLIYRFLKFLDQDKNRENFIKSNTLINEGELFPAIKSKNFVLVTNCLDNIDFGLFLKISKFFKKIDTHHLHLTWIESRCDLSLIFDPIA